MKLKIIGRRLFTEAGYPMGERFYMHEGWPKCGWGPFMTDAEADAAKDQWEAYLAKQPARRKRR